MPAKVSPMLRAILELRDGQRAVQDELHGVRTRVDGLEMVMTRELGAVGAVLVDIRELLRDRLDVRDRVDDHERRLERLERRAG